MAPTITDGTSPIRAATAALLLLAAQLAGCTPAYHVESYRVDSLSGVGGGGPDSFFVLVTYERVDATVDWNDVVVNTHVTDTDATVLRCTVVERDGVLATDCRTVLTEGQAAEAARIAPPPAASVTVRPPSTVSNAAICKAYRAKIADLAAAGRRGTDLPVLPEECER